MRNIRPSSNTFTNIEYILDYLSYNSISLMMFMNGDVIENILYMPYIILKFKFSHGTDNS